MLDKVTDNSTKQFQLQVQSYSFLGRRKLSLVDLRLVKDLAERWATSSHSLPRGGASEAGRPGALDDELVRRRFRLPVRAKGCGVRSQVKLAPAAFAANFIAAARSFLPSQTGEVEGFFPCLEPLFPRDNRVAGVAWLGGFLAPPRDAAAAALAHGAGYLGGEVAAVGAVIGDVVEHGT